MLIEVIIEHGCCSLGFLFWPSNYIKTRMKPFDALCGVEMEVLTDIFLNNVSPNHSIMATLSANTSQLPCSTQLILLPSLWGTDM